MGYPVNPELGWYYVVSVAGEVGGVYYEVGDWIVWNGATWDRIAGERIVNLNQIITRKHADLQEVLGSQHHDKTVSGEISLAGLLEKLHASLTGIGSGDHHVKTVSGEISLAGLLEKLHASLAGIGIDDHHPKVHGDESHSSDMGYLFYKGGWDASGV